MEKSLVGKPLCYSCSASVCLESSLTQVLPVKGRLAQELREASHIPKAQVGSLTRQRMDTMGCIPAKTNMSHSLSKYIQLTVCYFMHSARLKCHPLACEVEHK